MLVNTDARTLVARLRLELERLTEAVHRASGVIVEIREMLQRADETPSALSISTGATDGEDANGTADVPTVPRWDAETRTLSVGRRIVKQYRVPSRNQEAVLAAFQEEGWPLRIDDPLPCRAGLNAKYRLHFTVGRLNRCGRESLIRFFGDGTGEGVCWEFSDAAIVSLAPAADGPGDKSRAA
jgi:hypothetical protein